MLCLFDISNWDVALWMCAVNQLWGVPICWPSSLTRFYLRVWLYQNYQSPIPKDRAIVSRSWPVLFAFDRATINMLKYPFLTLFVLKNKDILKLVDKSGNHVTPATSEINHSNCFTNSKVRRGYFRMSVRYSQVHIPGQIFKWFRVIGLVSSIKIRKANVPQFSNLLRLCGSLSLTLVELTCNIILKHSARGLNVPVLHGWVGAHP